VDYVHKGPGRCGSRIKVFPDFCVIPLAQFETQDDTSQSTFKDFISVSKRLAKSSREVDQGISDVLKCNLCLF
jgi:hypothetical protein